MKLSEYILKAQKVLVDDIELLQEHAGSEGLSYILKTPKELTLISNNILTLSDLRKEDELNVVRINFSYPRDYGFALNSIKAVFGELEIASLELLF